ncbi:PTS transporter subunit EIIC [Catenibacterium sp.]|uniref:PTS transporter subunit EIIC n=1 Tax=Catenibacterium sp. TaxID=2049022 RepID=UPI003FD74EED
MFLAIILGLAVPSLYCWLMKKNLRLKLPDSVPPMVSQSLAPTFVTMIIFTTIFVIKYACTFTPYGNLFTLVSTLIGKPIAAFGANPVSLIIVFTLMNLIWFFGVHPNAILMPYMPILTLVNLANQEAFLAGNALPYLTFAVVATCVQIGGAGNTLGLCIASFFAKSEKYKAMRKLVTPANIFNINEPVIFGFPVMLNPLYFFPMVFSPAIVGLVTYGLCQIFTFNINPTIAMPWVTPGFVTAFFQGGLSLLLVWILAVFIDFILYLPFFLIDDKNTLKLEQENTK